MNITTAHWKFLKDLCDLELVDCKITVAQYKGDAKPLIKAGYILVDKGAYRPTMKGRKQNAMRWAR